MVKLVRPPSNNDNSPLLGQFNRDKLSQDNSKLANINKSKYNQPRKKQLEDIKNLFFENKNKQNNLMQILMSSSNDAEIFKKYYRMFENYDDLVAIEIFTEQKAELLNYYYKNDSMQELILTPKDKYNIIELDDKEKEFKQFLIEHPSFSNRNSLNKDDDILLPHIYMLGNKYDFELLEAMSLNTKILLLDNIDNMKIFEKDENNKIVILSDNASFNLQSEYSRIFDEQYFKTLNIFHNDKSEYNVTPFNRNNLIKHIINIS